MTIDNQVKRLNNTVADMVKFVETLNRDLFLEKINNRWSSRDIIAHLTGWNRHVIKGGGQIINGELPFYDIDPGENFSNVNAVLIKEYSSEDKNELIEELNNSAAELAEYLQSIDQDTWSKDFGVRHAGEIITIRDTVDELIDDYSHHIA
ncbi:ClbS/DfsB family four-helix bundle protein, partial [candidate division KSB1 bacterium]